MATYDTIIIPIEDCLDEFREALIRLAPNKFQLLIERFDKFLLKTVLHVIWTTQIHSIGSLNVAVKKLLTKEKIKDVNDKAKFKSKIVENILESFEHVFNSTEKYEVLYNKGDFKDSLIIERNKFNEHSVLTLEKSPYYILHYAKKYNVPIDFTKTERYVEYFLAHMERNHSICVTYLYKYIKEISKSVKNIGNSRPIVLIDFI